MPFISITRLRIRAFRFLPGFAWHTQGSLRQVRAAAGFRQGALLPDRHRTFWTMTAWDTQADMRAFMTGGAHRKAMPRLMTWCDEASVVHWDRDADGLPDWIEAEARMRRDGRPSRVRHPSPDHAGMTFATPRVTAGGTISPKPARIATPAPPHKDRV